jgi:hypothetical protein
VKGHAILDGSAQDQRYFQPGLCYAGRRIQAGMLDKATIKDPGRGNGAFKSKQFIRGKSDGIAYLL